MNRIDVIYWSSTGNTKEMAEAVAEGIRQAGKEASVLEVSQARAEDLKDAERFALGASAMGAEELDPEMDRFVSQAERFASGKRIGLFGSYSWGDGAWMREWENRMRESGAVLVGDAGVIAADEPGEEDKEACRELGRMLV